MKEHKKRTQRQGAVNDTRGAVYVEFIFAFMPMFTLMLGLIHLGFLYTASLVVQHSASTAVRAAIVVGPDRPSRYGKAAYNNLNDGCGRGAGNVLREAVTRLGGALNTGGGGGLGSILGALGWGGAVAQTYNRPNGRLDAIADAAAIPLLAAAPKSFSVFGQAAHSIGGSMGSGIEAMGAAYFYNLGAVAVTFPTAPRADSYTTTLSGNVTVRVTYLYYCPIPIVRQFACYNPILMGLLGTLGDSGAITGTVSDIQSATNDLTQAVQNLDQIGISLAMSRLRLATDAIPEQMRWVTARKPRLAELRSNTNLGLALVPGFFGGRNTVLVAEATLPLQTASYQFNNEPVGCSSGGGG